MTLDTTLLKPFQPPRIGYWLDNPIYYGELLWEQNSTGIVGDTRIVERNAEGDMIRVPDFCKPIVSRETWDAVQAVRQARRDWRKQAALQGPLSLLERKQRATPPTPPIIDGEKEAQLTKIACSTPPVGRSRWTLQLLADELVALEIVDSISADTVGRVQKKRVKAVAQIDVVHSA